jgi:hypothetical protein
MGFLGMGGEKKSVSELQEEIEYKDAELTLEEKKQALKKLKQNNLSLSSFSGWKSAIDWTKKH